MQQMRLAGVETLAASRSQGLEFDVRRHTTNQLISAAGLGRGDVIVNCIGLTKSHIHEKDAISVDQAIRINALFPIELCRSAQVIGAQVIQVATDCVFSGGSGSYHENSSHDAHDVYGKTKSLGETGADNLMILRCSLIGPEVHNRNTLFFEWVRNTRKGAIIDGFADHRWNGLTSQSFGAIVAGIVLTGGFSPSVQHLVPADVVTKFELVKMELNFLERPDVVITETYTGTIVDRTLSTLYPDRNKDLFSMGGFDAVPTIHEMMERLPWAELRIR